MKKKVKFLPGLIVLSILMLLTLVFGLVLFIIALSSIKQGESGARVIGDIIILLFTFIVLGISAIFASITLPLSIISFRKSENKKFPLCVIICASIILMAAIIIIVLAAIQPK